MSTLRSDAPANRDERGPRDLSRVYAGLVTLCAIALLLVGASLRPSVDGHGTHEQMGLPACAFAQHLGKPCATCGMTTAVAHAANGNLLSGVVVQPFGAGIAVAASVAFWISLYVAATGSRLWRLTLPLMSTRPMLLLAALLMASWVYKILVWNPA